MAEPHVGIAFLVSDRLFTESTPLSESEEYGDFRIHGPGHDAFWSRLLKEGSVSGEYDEWPRARVAYSVCDEQFRLLADRCILRRPEVIQRILDRLHLPRTTVTATDSHYLCPACVPRAAKNTRE